jgi:hypothetical protein
MSTHISIILRCVSYGHKGTLLKGYKYEIEKKLEKNDTEVAESSVDVTTH